MRKLLVFLPLVALVAFGQVTLEPSVRTEFTDCASGGSASNTLAANTTYLMRVTDADVFLCLAPTCATGGERFPSGTVLLYQTRNAVLTVSCRSSASTGDIIFTKADSP
jgi:hypothetical protein